MKSLRRWNNLMWSVLLATGGCTNVFDAQLALIDQTQRGVTLTQTALDDREKLADELRDLERKRMDDAFDADVRGRAALDADWVIEARQAYAAGIEAIDAQRQTWRERTQADRSNLDAANTALGRLRTLQEVQMKLFDTQTP